MRKLASTLVICLAAVACAGDEPAVPTTVTTVGAPATTPPESTSPDTTSGGTTVPGAPTALDERLSWLTGILSGDELTEADYQATFTADFIANVGYGDFAAVVDQMPDGTWTVGEFEDRQDLAATVLLVPGQQGDAIRARISLEPSTPFRIQGLFLQPATPPTLDDPPQDFEAAAARMGESGETNLAVFEVIDGGCQPVFEHGDGGASPLGSAIKLYVLGAVVDAVAAGDLSWSDDVTISDDLKSIPTGVMQDEEAGATFSLREMAEVMIALSDNTATDHLIDLVGRPAVEAAQGAYGHAEPGLNVPFMNTMDLAALKVGPASGLATQWLDAAEAGRRQILEQVSDITPADIPLSEFVDPVMPDRIEWFASPADMCRVLAALYEVGEPVDKILTINPGLPDEDGDFEAIAFKGGSEPGLVSMNWLVDRPDGRRFVVAGSVVNGDEAFDELEVTLLFGAVRDLVADE